MDLTPTEFGILRCLADRPGFVALLHGDLALHRDTDPDNAPSEVQRARRRGLRVLKLFPAGIAGGVPMLKALASVYSDVSFVPTGGVSAGNLAEYLAVPNVAAVGGSWLVPKAAVAEGRFEEITSLAIEAREIAAEVR